MDQCKNDVILEDIKNYSKHIDEFRSPGKFTRDLVIYFNSWMLECKYTTDSNYRGNLVILYIYI